MGNKRIQFIDTAKFLGLLFVVFFHGYKEGTFIAFMHSFLIPLFFFLNGMTLKLDNISSGDYLIKKLKGYAIPTIGLGILGVILDASIKKLLLVPLDVNFWFRGIQLSINQTRFFAIWFLSALLFSDIFIFALHKKFKGNIWLMGLGSLAILGLGIFYNSNYKGPMVWNVDAALFGLIFTYLGYLLSSKNLSRLYRPIIESRWISLLVGAILLTGTFFLSSYIFNKYQTHLNMFGNVYGKYYLTLPCALIGTLGFTFTCRGITNSLLAYPVKFNLVLLILHQTFSFVFFRYIVAPHWWAQVSALPVSSLNFNLFNLVQTVLSALMAAALYGVIIITPFSFIVNKPRYPLFENIIRRVRK